MKQNKQMTNLFLDKEIFDYFTEKATEELEDECTTVNQITLQRRRARLMVDILTNYYEAQ